MKKIFLEYLLIIVHASCISNCVLIVKLFEQWLFASFFCFNVWPDEKLVSTCLQMPQRCRSFLQRAKITLLPKQTNSLFITNLMSICHDVSHITISCMNLWFSCVHNSIESIPRIFDPALKPFQIRIFQIDGRKGQSRTRRIRKMVWVLWIQYGESFEFLVILDKHKIHWSNFCICVNVHILWSISSFLQSMAIVKAVHVLLSIE